MAGNIATAKAFLDAGNPARARDEIERVLKDDPANFVALDVYCRILRDMEQWDRIEEVTKEWLGRDGTAVLAYANLLLRYQRGKMKKEAARLKEQFTRALSSPSDLAMLNDIYEISFGDKAGTWSRLSDEAAAAGDYRWSFNLASKVAALQFDFSKALLEAEFARRTGDNSVGNLENLSVLSFRLMRFSRCRSYARMALQADPARMLPRELIFLSRIAYLPPFLVVGMAIYFFNQTGRLKSLWFLLVFCILGPAAFVFFCSMLMAISLFTGIPFRIIGGGSLVYFVYVGFMLGTVSRFLQQRGKAPVRLKDY